MLKVIVWVDDTAAAVVDGDGEGVGLVGGPSAAAACRAAAVGV